MPTVYDREGNAVDLPAEQVPAALASGKYGLPKDEDVHVFDPSGQIGTVKGDKALEALGAGYRLASDQEVTHARAEQKYGGLGGAALSAGLEGLSQGTVGLSDAALGAIGGEEYRELRRGGREANPNATLAGGIVGGLAPALATGGESAVAEGAELAGSAEEASAAATLLRGAGRTLAAPAKLVSRAGRGVEDLVGAAFGEGETSLATALAKRVISKGAGAATEGAFIGAGQQLSEDSLGDPDANGEKLLAALGHGALIGFVGGAGLTVAGELGGAVLGRLRAPVSHMAEEQAVRSVIESGRRKAFVKELERIPGGARAAGRQMLEDGILDAGDDLEAIAPKLTKAKDEAGERVGAILDAADKAEIEGPKLAELREQIEKDVLSPLEKLPKTNAGAISKVRGILDDLESYLSVPSEAEAAASGIDRAAIADGAKLTFRQAQDFRGTIGKSIDWKANPLAPVDKANEAAKDVYRIIERSVEQKGEQAAQQMGGSFLKEYKQAKVAYQRYVTLDKAAQEGLAAKMANRVISPSDYGVGAALGAGALAHAAAGPVGAVVAGAKGLAAAIAHHELRTRGNSTAAVLLDKLSALRGVESAVRSVDREMDRGVAGLFREKGRAPIRVEPIPSPKGESPYRAHTEAVRAAQSSGEHHEAAIQRAVAPLATHAPRTAQAFQSAGVRATEYLASRVPQRLGGSSIQPQFDTHPVSPLDEANYLRVAHAVHDPMSVLRDLGDGRATRDQIDTLRDNYPAIYREIVQKVGDRLADTKHPLDYTQRLQIGLLLGIDADPTQAGPFVASMQATYAQQPAGPAPAAGSPPRGAPKRPITAPAKDTGLSTGLHAGAS